MKTSNSTMRSYKLIVCGLIGSVLLVTALFVTHECDPKSARPWNRRLPFATTGIYGNQDTNKSPDFKSRLIRLKSRNNKNTSIKRGLTAWSPETGYDMSVQLGGRTSTSGDAHGHLKIGAIPGQRSSSVDDWYESDIGDMGAHSLGLEVKGGEPKHQSPQEDDIRRLYDEDPKKTVEYYGVPVKGQNFVVIYNAVPKTGSRAFFGAIRKGLNSSGNTKHVKTGNIRRRYRQSRAEYFNFIYNRTPPEVLRGHVPFVGLPSRFLYINMVREPMERFVSEYYFMRNGDGRILASSSQRSHGYNPKNLPDGWNDTLDECVRKGSQLCLPGSGIMRLFCGFSLKCSTSSRWTLDQAKSNLDRYTVVGLTDEFEASLKVLGRLLPDMTGSITREFKNQTYLTSKYQTHNRQEPLETTKKSLRFQMVYEYEFYHLVKDKFNKLKGSMGIS